MIYLLGASHIMAILDACRAEGAAAPTFGPDRPPSFHDWPLQPGLLPDGLRAASIHISHTAPFWGPRLVEMLPDGQLGIAPGLQALLASANDDASAGGASHTLFVAPRGEEYFHLSLEGVDAPYDFVLLERPDLAIAPGRAVLPLAVVRDRLAQQVSRTVLLLTAIRRLCPRLQVLRLPAPPPTASADVATWAAGRGQPPHPAQHLPSAVRLKLWLLHQQLLAQGTAPLDLPCLPVPAEATHAGGLLRPDHMEDPIHGNARYGALVCAQMAARVSPAPTKPVLEGALG